MASWFTMDDVNCEDFGIHVLEFPPLLVPQRRSKLFTVPGGKNTWVFDGDWGYEDVEKEVRCTVDEDASLDDVCAYLLPSVRRICFGNDPAFEYTGFCLNQVDIGKVLRERKKREFTIVFQCSPFKLLAVPDEPFEMYEGGTISHPGTARSYPRIQVEGEGDVTLTFHAVDQFQISGLVAGTPFVIDSGAMICTDETGTLNWSARASGDYPWLDPGANLISWQGSVTKITLTPNFAWV